MIADVPIWFLLIAPMVFFASLQLIGSAIYVRSQKYKRLSFANFLQQAGTPVLQVALGVLGLGVYGLLAGFALARTTWIPSMVELFRANRQKSIDGLSVPQLLRKGLTPGLSGLMNSIGGQLIILLPVTLYGSATGGLVGMAVRILISPLGLVSQSVASAANGQVGQAFRSGDIDSALRTVWRGMRGQAMIGIVPLAVAGGISPWLIPRLLGEQWREAGIAITALTVGALFQFAVAPFAQILNITGESKALLAWDSLRLVAYSAALAGPFFLGCNWIVSIWSYSGAQVLLYVVLMWIITRRLKNRSIPKPYSNYIEEISTL